MIQTAQRSTMNGGEKILGVEGGGTKTSWVLAARSENELRVLDQGKLPPANFRLATPDQLRVIFSELPKQVNRAGIFLAGCGTEAVRPLPVVVTSGLNMPAAGDTFWVTPAAAIFLASRHCA